VANRFLYIFLDEAGNRDFSKKGTQYFLFSAIVRERPFEAGARLVDLKYDLIESGMDIHRFHASEDEQAVRDQVFSIIQSDLERTRVEALFVEKRKTHPNLQREDRFYPELHGYFLRHILLATELKAYKEILVFTDKLPAGKNKKQPFEKIVKETLSRMLPPSVKYRLLHHDSQSCMDLQIADYCTWAIYRKLDRRDFRSYDLIKSSVRKEFDLFRKGQKHYY
jgi:Protein of unknown function (DUF3800)